MSMMHLDIAGVRGVHGDFAQLLAETKRRKLHWTDTLSAVYQTCF